MKASVFTLALLSALATQAVGQECEDVPGWIDPSCSAEGGSCWTGPTSGCSAWLGYDCTVPFPDYSVPSVVLEACPATCCICDGAFPTAGPVSATFTDNVGNEHPDTVAVEIDQDKFVFGATSDYTKMVVVNRAGTSSSSPATWPPRYAPSGLALQ